MSGKEVLGVTAIEFIDQIIDYRANLRVISFPTFALGRKNG
jgi:hypothetical protein